MPRKINPQSLRENSINLLVICSLFIFVFGCFCPANKDSETYDPSSESNKTVTNTSKVSNSSKSSDNKSNPTTTNSTKDVGDFLVQQNEVSNPAYKEIDRQVKQDKVLEGAAAQLNKSLMLPFDITLTSKACDEINAFYNPSDHSITVCYELMEHYYKLYKSAGKSDQEAYDRMNDTIRFAFLHEVGHALIDAYKLPIMGNEEDAADRCSAYICLEELDNGVKYVLAAADGWSLESKYSSPDGRDFADEHLLNQQRFYNSLCMIYGSNTTKYDSFVKDGYLPKERAVKCPYEYERTMTSWKDLLKPWRKD
jgi:Putative metallopeptidase